MATDASPWGLGAVLSKPDGTMLYIADAITSEDIAIFGYELGDPAGQQTWEALIILVALRCWSKLWNHRRVALEVKSDSVSALTATLLLRARGPGPSLVARELALDIAEASFVPDTATHLPGVANVVPDALSRRFQPAADGKSKVWKVPTMLGDSLETIPPVRNRSYYRTLSLPP